MSAIGNVPHKRVAHTSECHRTRPCHISQLYLLITQQTLVAMASQTEGRLSLALQAYNNGDFRSLRAAAIAYDVPPRKLERRHQGILPRSETRPKSSKLTVAEEELLLQRILHQAAQGFPLQQTDVQESANLILKSRQPENPQQVGKNWTRNFINRYVQIKSIYNRKSDYQRACCEDPKAIRAQFQLVQDTVSKYGVTEADIYNFDETGFQMGVISTSKVVTSSERRGRLRTIQPGNREWVTAIQGINAKGWSIPPFIIFAAKLHQKTWYQCGLPPTQKIAVSENGWTNDELGLQWIQHFHQSTIRACQGKYRLLIFDGHGSHQTAQFREFCLQNHILTLCMPAHSSHILQPLDVSCFAPLKKAYSRQIKSKMRLSNNHITKVEFLPAFHTAHQQAMTAETILAGFAATGLVPFNPERVLRNLDTMIQSTPSPSKGSQSSWESKTLKTFPEIKKQAALIQKERRKRRRSSASLSDQHFVRLLKGFKTAVYDRAILIAENASLRAENQYQKQKRARHKGNIQKGGSLTI